MNEGIEMEKWMGYFEEFLGGVEEKTREQKRKKRDKEGEFDVGKEEMGMVIRELKNGTATGIDSIPGEVWNGEEKK